MEGIARIFHLIHKLMVSRGVKIIKDKNQQMDHLVVEALQNASI